MTNANVDHRATPLPPPPGSEAPDFELPSTPDQSVSLTEFRGRPVILAFYPEDWSPVCSDQMALYQEVLPEFQRFDAELFGISVDGVWSHLAFARDRNLHFPLLKSFDKDLAEHVHLPRVHEDFMSGVRSGVNGTPTFYVNGDRHDGSYEIETLLAVLERAATSERRTS